MHVAVLSLLGPAAVGAALLSPPHAALSLLLAIGATVVLDALLPLDLADPSPQQDPQRGAWLPRLHLPCQLALLLWAARTWAVADIGVWGRAGMAVGFGVYACAFGINVAHELIHRRSRLDRLAGGIMLAATCYGTFKIEHVRGHHVHVATPQDPSSAARGQGLWRFLPRAVLGNVAAAFSLERQRLAASGRPALSVHNEALCWTAASAAMGLGLGLAWGPGAVVFFLLQSFFAICTLEIINYVEHYGLRRRGAAGRFAPPGIEHSWSSPVRFSNALFFNIQRHADHHARPRRPYTILRHIPAAPQLPWGYPVMMFIAMLPPLWRRVMDHRIPRHSPMTARNISAMPACPAALGCMQVRSSQASAPAPR